MTEPRIEDGAGIALVVAACAMPLVVSDSTLGAFSIYFSYALFAASLAFIWGHVGLLSLGHAVFFGAGAYAMSVVTLGMLPGFAWLTSTWLGLAAAVLVPMGIAWMIGLFLFSSSNLQGPFFGIITLAIGVIAERLCISWDYLGGLNGLMSVPPVVLGFNGSGPELWETIPVFYVMLGLLTAGLLILRLVMRSTFGLSLAAVRNNELRCRALGYDTAGLKTRAYALSAGVAGFAGAMFVVQFGFASPSLIGFTSSAEVLIWVAVGGRHSPLAAALAAIAVRFSEETLSRLLGDTWLLVLGILFVACVMFLPRGVFGELFARLGNILRRRQAPITH